RPHRADHARRPPACRWNRGPRRGSARARPPLARARARRRAPVLRRPVDRRDRARPRPLAGDGQASLDRCPRVPAPRASGIAGGGLAIDETARALDLSPATVKRHWTVARAFLLRELQGSPPA